MSQSKMNMGDLETPCLVVDRVKLDSNIARMANQMESFGVALRPHWKTTKCIEIARLQVNAGAVGLTAATREEVLALVDGGIENVFWAYPPIGKTRIATAAYASKRIDLIVGVDSLAAVRDLSAAASALGTIVVVRLEVDTGLHRTGVIPDNALQVAAAVDDLPGIRLEGVYTHEGQVQAQGADPDARFRAGIEAGKLLVEVADVIRKNGIELSSVSVGSTPGAWSAPSVRGVTEARPGTYVYGDDNQVVLGTMADSQCALSVLASVISVEQPGTVIVDAGLKGMSSDSSARGDGRYGTVTSASGGYLRLAHEEHGFVTEAGPLKVGDVVRIRPNHACGTTNMYSHLYVIENGSIVDRWQVSGRH